ncbi:hypothetical protein A9976_28210 [Delftia sp. UME58]|nr:hypothetical protein [Delftia sp. UME58]
MSPRPFIGSAFQQGVSYHRNGISYCFQHFEIRNIVTIGPAIFQIYSLLSREFPNGVGLAWSDRLRMLYAPAISDAIMQQPRGKNMAYA